MARATTFVAALTALSLVAGGASAQDTASALEPSVQILLPPPARRDSEAPAVRAVRMLAERTTRELLANAFPARLHFRMELWERRFPFDSRITHLEWDVVVSYDPLAQHYTVARIVDSSHVEPLGTFAALKDAEAAVARAYVPPITPPRGRKRYYYFVALKLEMVTVTDIDELQRWLQGPVKEGAGTAIGRGLSALFGRLLGATRSYNATSATFRP